MSFLIYDNLLQWDRRTFLKKFSSIIMVLDHPLGNSSAAKM